MRLVILTLLLTPALGFASRGDTLVHATLFTDIDHPKPGDTFHLGVLFDIERGWHIYWRNPGDSGLASRLSLHLPPGYTAGPVQYALPTKITLPGNIVNYAYEQQTMLIVPVTLLAHADVSANVSVDASWLVCQDVCLPGKAQLTIALDPAHARSDLFARWQSKMPVDRDPAHVDHASVSRPSTISVRAVIRWKSPVPSDIQFFPPPLPGFELNALAVETIGSTTTIHYSGTPASTGGAAIPIDGLVEFTATGGHRIGLNIKPSP